MARSTVHYADSETNNILKKLHNKLRPAGTPVQRVEYIIELLMLRIFEVKVQLDPEFAQLRELFRPDPGAADEAGRERDKLLFSSLIALPNDSILPQLNQRTFPFYSRILGEARKVWKGNLSTKVQDQLVLIEEIFGNSNFTNNVTSGNMAEIIGLVADLDKDRLLKTDLLGDAIESALSETGGTKDIGLHRTPDHIRQFMVALIAPTFSDLLFDPTVGTGGFMFDSFEYVLQGVSRDGHWPGPKAHPELVAWFKAWFDEHPEKMPTLEVTTDFYRNGVGGIEYLGMVRKMAAINFYVRGLNPGNIQQGDALQKFGSEILPESKTGIVANPPFGAERDQASYPNVWKEHAAESETTILFVKLMVETLKQHGRCAVIVSEGFLTWDQNSARALRRALLDECNLQAIISLPQGVFVSKGGQGPKTSILYFVKGGQTRDVWFYKIANDGYTMGTNRKPVAGCQLVEALDLFHRCVREGKTPPETRHSFSIPAAWIKTLDPRVKDKIRAETRAEMSAKAEEDRAKLAERLDAQVAAKKLTATERKARLAEHVEVWRSKTENAIAQKIERAHQCSFNLSNYRSTLTPAQVAAWQDFAATRVREDDPSRTLEEKYRALRAAAPDDIDPLLSALDPRHTLELDLARQFLTGLASKVIAAHPHLQTLQEIIATQAKTPRVALRELLTPVERIANIEEGRTYRRVTVKLYGKGVQLRDRVTSEDMKGAKWFVVKAGELIFSKIDARNGAFGLVPEELDDAIVTSEFPTFTINEGECHPALLAALLTSERFYGQIEAKVSGASGRRRMEPEELLEMEVPLLNEQDPIVDELQRSATIQSATALFVSVWDVDQFLLLDGEAMLLGELADVDSAILKDLSAVADTRYVGGEHIESGTGRLVSVQTVSEAGIVGPSYSFRKGQVIYSKVRPNLRKCFNADFDGVCSSDIYPYTVKSDTILAEYLALVLASRWFARLTVEFHERAGMPKINRDQLATIRIVVPNPKQQKAAVAAYREGCALLETLEGHAARAQHAIQQTLDRIWEA